MSFLIEIPKRSRSCSQCQESFALGDEYCSLLKKDEKLNILRFEYCAACWPMLNLSEKVFWKARVQAIKALPLSDRTRDERALELFRDPRSQDSEELQEEAFVLALFLLRKKRIAFRQKMTDPPLDVYEILEMEELVAIKPMALASLNIDAIQKRIALKLSSE